MTKIEKALERLYVIQLVNIEKAETAITAEDLALAIDALKEARQAITAPTDEDKYEITAKQNGIQYFRMIVSLQDLIEFARYHKHIFKNDIEVDGEIEYIKRHGKSWWRTGDTDMVYIKKIKGEEK